MSNILFDRTLYDLRRDRIADNISDHDFLLKRVAAAYNERLSSIIRDFHIALELGSHHGLVGKMCEKRPQIKTIIHLESNKKLIANCTGLNICADTEMLPIKNESLDLVLSALSLSFVNDLPGVLVQIRRALKPDGLFLGTTFGSRTLNELRQVFYQAEEETTGGFSPRTIPMVDVRDCGALLQRAGFALPVADRDLVTVKYTTPWALLADLRGMGMTNILLGRHKKPLRKETVLKMIELYQQQHTDRNGKIKATFELLTLTGWAPHQSQQKPLKPGSANTRLAEALNTEEISSGEKAAPLDAD